MDPSKLQTPQDWLNQRQELEQAEYAFQNQEKWLKIRKEIEQAILLLTNEIEQEFHLLHQTGKFEKERDGQFQENIDKKRQTLRQLKKEQHQVDLWLDQTEDLSENQLHQLRIQLLYSLWELYPAKREEQEKIWKRGNDLKILELELVGIERILVQISSLLSIAKQTRMSIKGKGIFSYIFGLSPNFIIEKQLLEITTLISQTDPLFQKIFGLEQSIPLQHYFKELHAWLEKLQKNCAKSWSFKHLDILFSETEKEWISYTERLQHLKNQLNLEVKQLNEEFRSWLS